MKIILNRATKTVLVILAVLFAYPLMAQEMLVDLTGNRSLIVFDDYARSLRSDSRSADDTLSLPFFDDFSEPFSRLQTAADLYPNPARWIGNKVYINNHMGINPVSQGVATFDGLDERGRAYGFGFSLPSLSDSLTSKPIDLTTAPDTVYLSFFYQAQGMGNAPEAADILVLEFKDTAENWARVWEVEGHVLTDYKFNRVMLPVLGGEYLHAGFQFRFLNYASRAGSVDHWHIDYVDLDGGRTAADTLINDVSYMSQTSFSKGGALVSQTASLLSEYSAMPWSHYKETSDSSEYMLDTLHIALHNNFDTDKQLRFIYRVRNEALSEVYAYENVSGIQVFSNVVCGSELNDCNDDPFSNFRTSLNDFYFPHTSSQDSVYFLVEYVIDTINDAVPENDRSVFKQEFYNYYAYDDGTAELAYGLGNLENVGMVAMKYNIKKPDVLRAIQLYLNPVEFNLSQEPVQLAVWTGNEEPGDTLWTSPVLYLNYTDQVNYFYHYMLDREVPVDENIWIGWIQQPAGDVKFSVGFDQRNDASQKVFYNLGTTWNQSSIPGALMIRPVVGEAYDWVGVQEPTTAQQLTVYPNPSAGTVQLKEREVGQFADAIIRVYDLSGRSVFTQNGYHDQLNLSQLISGTYLLQVQTKEGTFTQRLMIAR